MVTRLFLNRVELPALGVGHKPVQFWPSVLCARHAAVQVLACDRPAAGFRVLLQLASLHSHILALIVGADSGVDCGFHIHPPSPCHTPVYSPFVRLIVSNCVCGLFYGPFSMLIVGPGSTRPSPGALIGARLHLPSPKGLKFRKKGLLAPAGWHRMFLAIALPRSPHNFSRIFKHCAHPRMLGAVRRKLA
jgi:hypothetical protein